MLLRREGEKRGSLVLGRTSGLGLLQEHECSIRMRRGLAAFRPSTKPASEVWIYVRGCEDEEFVLSGPLGT